MISDRLKDFREDNDLYQKDISKKIGVSQQTYSMWENGTKIIPLKHLNTLCNIYDISMDYFLGFSNKNKSVNKINILNKNDIGNRIREVRKKNNLTVRDLASYLNTTPSTISAYENGKTLILTAFAYQICIKYNISMDYLCCKK